MSKLEPEACRFRFLIKKYSISARIIRTSYLETQMCFIPDFLIRADYVAFEKADICCLCFAHDIFGLRQNKYTTSHRSHNLFDMSICTLFYSISWTHIYKYSDNLFCFVSTWRCFLCCDLKNDKGKLPDEIVLDSLQYLKLISVSFWL